MSALHLVKYLSVAAVSATVTWLFTPLAGRVARRWGIIDKPRGRHRHAVPTPRLGGLAVFVGFHCGCAVAFLGPWASFTGTTDALVWLRFLGVSTLLLVVGILDDRYVLRAHWKLLGQAMVAVVAYALDMRLGGILSVELPPLLDLAATMLWFLVIINAFNLIDGMDGLASGLAAIASVGLAVSFFFRRLPADTLVMLSLLAACLAFLRYNFHPASIFLGDSGSMFLGLVLAAVPLWTHSKGMAMASIGMPMLAVGVPLFVTMLAVWRRSIRRVGHHGADGASIMQADHEHLHHRLAQRGYSQRRIATGLYALNAALVGVGLLLLLMRSRSLGIVMIALVAAIYVVVRHLANLELWDTGRLLAEGLHRPPRRALAVLLYPPIDFVLLAGCCLAAQWLAYDAVSELTGRLFKSDLPIWVGTTFLALAFSGTYRRVWSRARVTDYVVLVGALLGGCLAGAGVSTLIAPEPARLLLRRSCLFAGLAVTVLTGLRAFPRIVQDAFTYFNREPVADAPRLLVVGADFRTTLYLRSRVFGLDDPLPCRPRLVGLVDADRNLLGRVVHGYRVLGTPSDLPQLLEKHAPIDGLVITTQLSEEDHQTIVSEATARALPVSVWHTDHQTLVPASGTHPAEVTG